MQGRSLCHPSPIVTADVRLPECGLAASQLEKFGVTPPEPPLQHHSCHQMHKDSLVGFMFVLQLLLSQPGGDEQGLAQVVTPLLLKVVTRVF